MNVIADRKEDVNVGDWVSLLLQAKAIGVTVEEIRSFFEACNLQKEVDEGSSTY
ncbi:anti-repressor SinI family protein [Paenibacillus silvisoli]|uniref:anti-repressor SinI family protein n=1 Tax=Paenibacillus silvisoli TaxID=3110539 RepID=UPI002805D1E1|nr:anti-repressor SinI family protein [Paenibacillus silvisoli]